MKRTHEFVQIVSKCDVISLLLSLALTQPQIGQTRALNLLSTTTHIHTPPQLAFFLIPGRKLLLVSNQYQMFCSGIVLCFGGGVLLSTVLIHMMKEVRELLERATMAGIIPKDIKYPFAELLLCIGE